MNRPCPVVALCFLAGGEILQFRVSRIDLPRDRAASDIGSAAYRCVNGHLIDPAQTRQCPTCGVHHTLRRHDVDGVQHFQCTRRATGFTIPH